MSEPQPDELVADPSHATDAATLTPTGDSPRRTLLRASDPQVALAFVWQLFGGLLCVPHWLLDLSPFQHVGLVPAQSFRASAAAVMLAAAAASALAAMWAFTRRDLIGQ